MPEGHTTHRLAQDLAKDLVGEKIAASSPQGRFDDGAARLHGTTIEATDAWGKHLFIEPDTGEFLHIHLGLIGKFRRSPAPQGEPTGVIRLRLEGKDGVWDLSGPNTCELITPERHDEITSRLGPDPLRPRVKPAGFVERLTKKRVAVGAALLDQEVIAGIGNVYRAELLFLLGIDPRRPAKDLTDDEATELWKLTVSQMKQGKKLNRIVTVDPKEIGARSAAKLTNADRLYAYKREGLPCRRCGTEIEIFKLASRSTWWCPSCQA